MFCLSGKSDEAGGYKWRYTVPASGKLADDDDAEEEVKEDAWIAKLPMASKEYKSGGYLRDYQVEGLRWLLRCWYQKKSSILADEMGLGNLACHMNMKCLESVVYIVILVIQAKPCKLCHFLITFSK